MRLIAATIGAFALLFAAGAAAGPDDHYSAAITPDLVKAPSTRPYEVVPESAAGSLIAAERASVAIPTVTG
jgi:hypothetical protein